MPAKIIDGKQIARAIRANLKDRVAKLSAVHRATTLAVIIVGDDAPSQVYVRNKINACAEIGIRSLEFKYPKMISERELLASIESLNARSDVDGILVQLPLPKHIAIQNILRTISVDKDVDGFHLYNVGGLVVGDTVFPPCTPFGVMKILEYENIEIAGKNAVVVGASNIVGKPMALMLMQRDATVSICHAKTKDLVQYTILADILIVAAGCMGLITAPMVKTGAVVIDVGINRKSDGTLVGDVDYSGVSAKAAYITPVPGGVGPMTVTMLLWNTVTSAERSTFGNAKRVFAKQASPSDSLLQS